MRALAQKQNQPQKPVSSNLAGSHMETLGLHRPAEIILHLQRTFGNQAVQRMLQTSAVELKVDSTSTTSSSLAQDFSRIPVQPTSTVQIQAQLKVNTPGDVYEQEAERTAEEVMRMPEAQLQRACVCVGGCAECQAERQGQAREHARTQRVQTSDKGETSVPPIVHEVLRSPGQPLDAATRAFMEPRFGRDFSQVRIHTDVKAAKSARAVKALAYTVGHNVVFGAGRYLPGTSAGQRLLAHELTHVVQQNGGQLQQGKRQGREAVHGNLEKVRLNFLTSNRPSVQRTVNQQARNNLRTYFSNPEPNVDRIIDWLQSLGRDAPETIRGIRAVERVEYLRQLAATAAGRRILDWLRDRWRRWGNDDEKHRAQVIDYYLRQVGRPGTVVPGDQASIDLLNVAFQSDPHRAAYLQSVVTVRGDPIRVVPLQLPVVAKPPIPQDGGVYWDRNIPAEGGTVGSLQSVYMAFGRRAVELHGQRPSIEWMQSVFWHEYQHYVQWFELRRQSRAHEYSNAVLTADYRTGAPDTNAELEATSFQLADALVRVTSDTEVDGIVGYLALHMGHQSRNRTFVDEATNRVIAGIRTDRARLQRLIRLIDQRGQIDRTALAPLRGEAQLALSALPTPTPPPGRAITPSRPGGAHAH